MRLFVAIPSYGQWESDFGVSLALTMSDLTGGGGISYLHLAKCEATIIAEGRSDLAKDAIEHGASHILWADTDMVFRPKNVRALMAHDVDVVACTYPKRRPPHVMTAQGMDSARLYPGDGGLIEAKHVGFGLALTKVSVFEKLPEPWFAFPWIADAKQFMGEDVWFCHHARAHDIQTFVCPVASQGVGHVGKQVLEAENGAQHLH